jgi:hypothetical protein
MNRREEQKMKRAMQQHKDVLKKYEENPPQLPHEHKAREISEKALEELMHQYNSLLRND